MNPSRGVAISVAGTSLALFGLAFQQLGGPNPPGFVVFGVVFAGIGVVISVFAALVIEAKS